MLALPAPGSEEDKVTEILCGICFLQKRVEPAGHAFHAAHEKPLLDAKKKKGKPAADDARGASDDEQGPADDKWKNKKKQGGKKGGSLKFSPALEGEDLYALLEVTESSSADQIKKSYRKLALKHHPDKQDAGDGGGDQKGLSDKDMLFVKIQEAYEILSDATKRRQYDSTLDFDDSIVEQVDEKLGFYGTFGPVFRRNARWSVRTPVPDLGDDKTDMSRVRKFYDFWYSFETWRDFSVHDEYNLDDAEFREERRWMDRQNASARKKYEQAERKRIFRLAEAAERLDPRILAERDAKAAKKREEKERKQKLKQNEEDEKRRAKEEQQLREEQEKAEAKAKAKASQEAKKQRNQELKALKQRLEGFGRDTCGLATDKLLELKALGHSLELEPLQALCERLEAVKPASKAKEAVETELQEHQRRKAEELEEQARLREERKRQEEEARKVSKEAAVGAPWSTAELGVLAKGLQKFPGGVGGRWALIAQFLGSNGFKRSEKEVVEKTKELSQGQSLRAMGSHVASNWTPPSHSNANAKAKATPAAAPATSAAPKAAAAEGSNNASAEWSPEQQKALEAALQKHPASLDKNERWKLIAEDVPGKTKAECVARFKYLREQLQKKA